jgi:ubiquinone biosynthesis protein UbiJ
VKVINQVAQRVLALDPEVRDAFSALGDRVIEIQFTELGQSCYLSPVPEGLSITTERPLAVATVIKGTIVAMISNAIHQKLFGGYRTEGLSIEGDMELAKEFNHLTQQYSIDWEELLSGFIGDVSAHHVGNAARDVRSWSVEAHESLMSDISEYLQVFIKMSINCGMILPVLKRVFRECSSRGSHDFS